MGKILKLKNERTKNQIDANQMVLDILDKEIKATSRRLEVAMKALDNMKPGEGSSYETGIDKNGKKTINIYPLYEKQVDAVDKLTKDLALLCERREQIVHPRVDVNTLPWYKRLVTSDTLKASLVIGSVAAQTYCLYKLQKDGYILGNYAPRMRMPNV